jgi:hypothetical protein
MRLTVLMIDTPFVVPMIEPAMPITIAAIQRRVGTLQHAAHRMLLETFRPGSLRYVRQRPDRLTRSCSNEQPELVAEISMDMGVGKFGFDLHHETER